MKTIAVTLESLSPLLMHKLNPEDLIGGAKVKKPTRIEDYNAVAERAAHFTKDKKSLMIPAQMIYMSMLNCSSFKKVDRKSLKTVLAGSIKVSPEEISLGSKKYEVDLRAVNNRGSRILCARPRIDFWVASFEIDYDENMVNAEVIKEVLVEAGQRMGIGAYRPQKAGSFGRFKIKKWEVK